MDQPHHLPFETSALECSPTGAARLPRRASAAFEQATLRQGRAEHEWFDLENERGSGYESSSARMVMLPNRCLASCDGAPIQIDVVICTGAGTATLDVLHRLPEGSWLCVEDAWDWPLFEAGGDEGERRTRVELPAGRVRIRARLEDGGRLSVRIAAATTANAPA